MKHLLKAEISEAAIEHNILALRAMIGPTVSFCAVVKSDAYGHGIDLLWPVIAENAEWLAVASADEAVRLRDLGYAGPLLMFFCARSCGVGAEAIEYLAELIHRNVTLTVTDPADVELIKLAASSISEQADVHVEVDSGMTRSGVPPDHLRPLLSTIRETPDIRLGGIYTHFATADDANVSFTRHQMSVFDSVITPSHITDNVIIHCANSAAVSLFPESHMDMVRVGLMMYGCRSTSQITPALDLRPVLRLTSDIMQIHEVPRGARIGYGLTYTCKRSSRIGLVPAGYGDGYMRALSNAAVVRVGDAVAPVVGRVSMDQITIDLTDIPGVMVGDEVELISNDPHAPNRVEHLAAAAETIPYEILTGMRSHRIGRVLVDRTHSAGQE